MKTYFGPIRGGGGNFGIVTELEFDTFQKPELVAGVIAYDAKLLSEFLSFYRDFLANAPDELTVEVIASGGQTTSNWSNGIFCWK